MFTLNMLLQRTADVITVLHMPDSRYLRIDNVVLLSSKVSSLNSGTLYIGSAPDLARTLAGWEGTTDCVAVLAGGNPTVLAPFESGGHFTCLYTSLSVQQIGNRVMEELFQFNRWCDEIRGGIYGRMGLHQLLGRLAKRIQAPLFWMNSGYHLLASDVEFSFEDKYIQELLLQGYLSAASVDTMLQKSRKLILPTQGRVNVFESVLDTGHYAILCEIWEWHAFLGQFLILSDRPHRDSYLVDHVVALVSFFWQYACLDQSVVRSVDDNGYTDLINDLIDVKIESEAELQSRAARLSPPLRKFYRCAVIGFEQLQRNKPYSSLYKALQTVFPRGLLIRRDQVLILLLLHNQKDALTYHTETLEPILETHHAYACFGGCSEFLMSFRSIFLQCESCLRLGMGLSESGGQRIFSSEKYHLYYVIDMCARTAGEIHGGDLIYLCSPHYAALRRYDERHQENLCGILHTYLHNNCNTSQTAKKLYLHRNTLINRLTKIEEIIGCGLDDAYLRTKLMFSDMVMDYIEHYRHENPFQLKRRWDQSGLDSGASSNPIIKHPKLKENS